LAQVSHPALSLCALRPAPQLLPAMAWIKAVFALASVFLHVQVQATAPGAIKLDNYTFDKVLAIPDHTFLVKFDQSYAYGEKEDEFKTLCKLAYSVPRFLIGEIPVQEYGDKDNDDLRERFKLTKDDFPVYYLFNADNKEGLKYTGTITASDLAAWLRTQKVKMPSIGTIAELDEIAKLFVKEGMSEAQLAEAKKMAEGQYSTDKKSAMYVKIMQKIKEKGQSYVAGEIARVKKILEGKVTPEKKTELDDKTRILGVFQGLFDTKDEL